jgi:glycosyltransferase involved in cell wall biosynthesis
VTVVYPKITVITVSYNAASTLLLTINGIFSQTYPNLEYIIIDGKSTDSTVEIIKEFQHKLAYWISEKDNGIYDAMNKGIKVSTGDWLIFLGADDVFYDENVLSEIFVNNKLDNIDFIYGDVLLKSKGKVYGGNRNYDHLIESNINHQSVFYNRAIFDKMGLFNLKYPILADFELNLRIFRDQSLIKKYTPHVVTIYNDKGLSNEIIDGNFFKDQLEYFLKVDKISSKDHRLQPYFFYYGFAQFLTKKRIKGLRNILYALTFGNRKFYYFLVSGKYVLSFFKIGKKIRAIF